MELRRALKREIRYLFTPGADVRGRLDAALAFRLVRGSACIGLAALNRALENVVCTTAVHIWFGYAAIIHVRPSRYSFPAGTAEWSAGASGVDETAQQWPGLSLLNQLPGKNHLGRPSTFRDRHGWVVRRTRGEPHRPPCPSWSARGSFDAAELRHEVPPSPAAFGKLQRCGGRAIVRRTHQTEMLGSSLKYGGGKGLSHFTACAEFCQFWRAAWDSRHYRARCGRRARPIRRRGRVVHGRKRNENFSRRP